MKEGFAVTFSTGTYFSVCRIGWLSHVEGDEWQIESARNVRRLNSAAIVSLVTCAGDLKKSGHELLDVNPEPEPVHRLHLTRPMPIAKADWPKWVKHFPALKEKLEAA